jgi:hypothetical protein
MKLEWKDTEYLAQLCQKMLTTLTPETYVVRQELEGKLEYVDESKGWVTNPTEATSFTSLGEAKACAAAFSDPPSDGRVHIAIRTIKMIEQETK